MAEKMSWTELRKQLAQRAGVTEKEAGAFWSAFNNQLVEALKKDKQLKINGLGTFKLQAVAPRRSVNVKTGEAMTIEGYNKIVFAPESGVKELVESKGERVTGDGKRVTGHGKPIAEPEIDPLRKLGEQANEIVDILGELGQAPMEGERLKVKGERKKSKEKSRKKKAEPIVEAPQVVEEEAKPVVEKKPEVAEVSETPSIQSIPSTQSIQEEPKKEEKPAKPKKKYHFLRDTLICVVCLLLVLLVGYFFMRSQLSSLIDSFVHPEPAPVEVVEALPAEEVAEPVSIEEPAESTEPGIQEAPVPAEAQPTVESKEPVYNELITIEPMHEASRLTWMSKRYYGEKKYWVYIYDANRDHIKNPSQIQVGTPIRVPKLTAAQKDTTLAETRATLERLTREAEAACRK